MQATHPNTYQLGNSLGEYGTSKRTQYAFLTGIFLILFGFGMLVIWRSNGDAIPLLVGIILVPAGLYVIWYWFRNRDARAQVFEQGIVYTRRGKTNTIRWDDIEALWQKVVERRRAGSVLATYYFYTLQQRDGAKFVFDDALANVQQLGTIIQQEVWNRLMPRAAETFRNGGTLRFGSLSADQTGLVDGEKRLPWIQVQGVRINQDAVDIMQTDKRSPWTKLRGSRTPNVPILMSLINSMTGGSAPRM